MKRIGCLSVQNSTDRYLIECAAPMIQAEEELNKHFETTITADRAYHLAMLAYDGDEKVASKYAAAAAKRESDVKSKSKSTKRH